VPHLSSSYGQEGWALQGKLRVARFCCMHAIKQLQEAIGLQGVLYCVFAALQVL
jgi:hypothetical protein